MINFGTMRKKILCKFLFVSSHNSLMKNILWFHSQAFFSGNAAALASRKSSPRVTNEAVQKAVSAFISTALFVNLDML